MIKRIGNTPIEEKHKASCHCGAVVLELSLPDGVVDPRRCDCSLCRRRGAIVASVPLAGIRILRHVRLDERAMLVVGVPIICSFFATLAPKDWVQTLPDMLQYLLGSAVTVGAMAAMVMNLILPRAQDDDAPARDQVV